MATAAAATEWVMNRSSSTQRCYWQRRRESAAGSTSTYDPPIRVETLRFEGFAPGPRDHDVWSLDRLVATDRQYLWQAARANLGWRDSTPHLPEDLAAAVDVMRAELMQRVDAARFPDLWNATLGAFVFLCPKLVARHSDPVVWRRHTAYTPSSQWTSVDLMPNKLLQLSYANRGVHTLSGKLKKLESAASPLEGMNLYHLVRDNCVKRSLEVGMACGLSTLYILQGMLDAHQDQLKHGVVAGAEAHAPETKRPAAASVACVRAMEAPAAAVPVPADAAVASCGTTVATLKADTPSSEYVAVAGASGNVATADISVAASMGEVSCGWKPRDHLSLPPDAFSKLPTPDPSTVARARAAAAAGFQHVSVDPYQLTQWKGAARSQVRVAGLEPLSSHLLLPSHLAMPAVERELGEGCMDLVFVDGMHLFDYTLVDLFLADRLTRVGGLIVLDDVKHAGVKDCVAYISTNYPHWQLLSGTACERTASTWVKCESDLRKWNFHVPLAGAAAGLPGKRARDALI